jgi:hypothetical protein
MLLRGSLPLYSVMVHGCCIQIASTGMRQKSINRSTAVELLFVLPNCPYRECWLVDVFDTFFMPKRIHVWQLVLPFKGTKACEFVGFLLASVKDREGFNIHSAVKGRGLVSSDLS